MKKFLCVLSLLTFIVTPAVSSAWIHVARDGETLEQLSVFYYGTRNKAMVIRAANGFMHPDDGSLLKGERVEIPGITYHVAKDGDDWYTLANTYLGSSRRASFLAELNSQSVDTSLPSGQIIKIPYQLLYIFAPDESLKSVTKMFLGKKVEPVWLKRYNLKKRKKYGRGDAILIPLSNVEYTAAAKKEIKKQQHNQVSRDDKKLQVEAVAQIAKLRQVYNEGRFIQIVSIATRLLAGEQLTKPQRIGVYKYLAFAYVAFDEPGVAENIFFKALKLQPSMELSPITVSPKILTVFMAAQKKMQASSVK